MYKRQDKGWAGVLRYTTPTDTPTMESIRFELGVRPSRAKYNHRQIVTEFDSLYNQASIAGIKVLSRKPAMKKNQQWK